MKFRRLLLVSLAYAVLWVGCSQPTPTPIPPPVPPLPSFVPTALPSAIPTVLPSGAPSPVPSGVPTISNLQGCLQYWQTECGIIATPPGGAENQVSYTQCWTSRQASCNGVFGGK
jgi:hypothetical protein